jgi:hypothetical protein
MLHHWGNVPAVGSTVAAPLALRGWEAYRAQWLAAL